MKRMFFAALALFTLSASPSVTNAASAAPVLAEFMTAARGAERPPRLEPPDPPPGGDPEPRGGVQSRRAQPEPPDWPPGGSKLEQ